MSNLTAILYRSESQVRNGKGGLEDILRVAQCRNSDLGITGILHWESGVFHQWLEGPEDQVRTVYSSICKDQRHEKIIKLSDMHIAERSFRFWSMVLCKNDVLSIFDWAAGENISFNKIKPNEILSFLHACSERLKKDVYDK